MLLAAAPPANSGEDFSAWLSHGGLCRCPICTGAGLNTIPVVESGSEPVGATYPLSSLPQLHSNAAATAKLVLDFNGHTQASWGSWSNITTPVYDQDGDRTTYSDGEFASITEIWRRVAEDYAPFNIDVTTVNQPTLANQVVAHIAIGGNWSDWYGSGAGGVAYIGGFYNGAPNVGYVFEDALGNGNAKYVAEAATHEAGHLFGLQHQALWNGTTLAQSYNSGNSAWAPHMGNGYYSVRTTWYNGTTSASPSTFQDDLAILSSTSNGFGYKADDFGSTVAAASALPMIGGSINFSGLIERYNDADVWSFTTPGGGLTLQLAGAAVGTNLDAVLELRNASGFVMLTSSPSNSLGASITTTVAAGTYYLLARSLGDYGDMGQYTITGSVPVGPPPEIGVTLSGSDLADGQSIDFGSTNLGQPVTRVFTVTNVGDSTLVLTPLNPAALPAGFSLVANLGSTSLAAGQSTQFSVRLDAAAFGTYGGALPLANNDADENPFDLFLAGTVLAPEITLRLGGASLSDGQTLDFGSAAVGSPVSRTVTVVNDGNSPLSLTAIAPQSLPAGFTLLSGLGATSLAAGQSTTFTIQFDAAAAGSFGGNLALANTDSNENPFDLVLAGVAYIPAPEISAQVAGQPLALGGLVDFGATVTGSTLERTITIRNDGTAALTLASLDPLSLPAGFSLYQNLGGTSLNPGQSTTFILRLDAAATGTFGGTVSLANSDGDESPFTFQVSGVVAAPTPPFKAIVDDGNAGSTLSGGWTLVTGKGYGNDIHTAYKGTGGTTATWTFNNLAQGQYQVWATWKISSTNATNAPFTIYDSATSRGTTLVNQQLTPSGLSADGALWKSLGIVTISSGKLVVKLTNAANNKVVADAIRVERVPLAPTPAAEIGVAIGTYEMTSGRSSISFGTRELGQPLTYAFTVTNRGTASLQLAALDPAALPAGFSLAQNLGSTFLTPGESATFALRLDATAAGSFGGTVSLANNDADENPFSFQIAGAVVDPNAPLVQIIDEGAAGNTLTGAWTAVTGKGYASDIHTAAAGSGSIQANWAFSSLPTGQYQVWATWKIASTYATNAPYSLYSGSQFVATTLVNQRLTPAGLWDGTTLWQSLGTVAVNGGLLSVRLTNAANGPVVADAIRIERIGTSGADLAAATAAASRVDWAALLPATLASAGAGEQDVPDALPLPAPTQAARADAWLQASRPLPVEKRLLAHTLDLLCSAAASTDLTTWQEAADALALDCCGLLNHAS